MAPAPMQQGGPLTACLFVRQSGTGINLTPPPEDIIAPEVSREMSQSRAHAAPSVAASALDTGSQECSR